MVSGLKDLRVILTACGAPGAPGILKSLRVNDERHVTVLGTDMNAESVGLKLVDEGRVVPPGDDPGFIDAVLSLIESWKPVDALIPLSTYELVPFASSVGALESAGVGIAISEPESLATVNDKLALYSSLKGSRVGIPLFEAVSDVHEFEEAARRLGYPRNRICFKPARGKGSRGFRLIDPEAKKLGLLFGSKPDATLSDYQTMVDTLGEEDSFPQSLVMEYLSGEEYSVDLLADKGRTLVCIPRRRLEMRQGISVRSVTEKNEELIALSSEVVSRFKLHGNIGIQFRMDDAGVPKLLEVNPRLHGTVVLCTAAGVNMPYLGLKLALGEDFDVPEPRWGVTVSRHWREVFYDESGLPYSL